MEYILVSTAAVAVAMLVVYFVRSTQDARESYAELSEGEYGEVGEANESALSAVMRGIFSVEDHQFIAGQSDPRLLLVFRRERKRLALRWIGRKKSQAAAIMRHHRQASRAASDLQPSAELTLLLRYAQLKLLCQFLAAFVWVAGPQNLAGLAEKANAVFQGVRNLSEAPASNRRSVSA